MRKKIIGIFVCIMLVLTTVVVIVPDDLKVEATPGGGGEEGGIGLDYQYIRNITENLSNVIFKYPTGMIPKGRAFGAWGEHFAAFNILQDEMINLSLYDPTSNPDGISSICSSVTFQSPMSFMVLLMILSAV